MSRGEGQRTLRCAIYTRKSTEEGLEQEFNSLDAQHEACSAYILSQRHEGWTPVKDRYDDGGFSGGTMERPGLKRLLADVASGKVDVIVVYKVDRLTRALSDFAKIVDVLDPRGASFVSVTQAFNTTTSMGRLTLNVLLSFAQFEREVTGERIRDKIAASKKKGMWMGGPVPLGYDVFERKLVINAEEASTVRHIFTRYLALGSGQALIEELRADGYRTRPRPHKDRIIGGVSFGRGMLFAMLSNRIYRGDIVHKGVAHPGEHQPIIEEPLWDAVQSLIEANRIDRKSRTNAAHASPLAGIITDGHGRKMSPSHAVKSGRRYRYYVTHASALQPDGATAWRIPAQDIESAVIDRVRRLLDDRRAITALAQSASADELRDAIVRGAADAQRLDAPYGRRSIALPLIDRVAVGEQTLTIAINVAALGRRLRLDLSEHPPIKLTAPAVKVRCGKATKLVVGDPRHETLKPNRNLVTLLQDARRAQAAVVAAPQCSIKEIALAQDQCRHRLMKLVRLSWLAPEIVGLILDGRQPATLTARRLLDAELPLAWDRQKALLGFC